MRYTNLVNIPSPLSLNILESPYSYAMSVARLQGKTPRPLEREQFVNTYDAN